VKTNETIQGSSWEVILYGGLADLAFQFGDPLRINQRWRHAPPPQPGESQTPFCLPLAAPTIRPLQDQLQMPCDFRDRTPAVNPSHRRDLQIPAVSSSAQIISFAVESVESACSSAIFSL
jgi:hypothetical protein